MDKSRVWILGTALLLNVAGCAMVNGTYPRNHSLLPDTALQVTPDYKVSLADAVTIAGVVALVYMVVDPAAPAWDISETRLPDNHVLYSLKMQRIHIGGDGEARQVLARRAQALANQEGFAGYEIRRYEESIDSRIFLPRRTVDAEIVMIPRPKAPANDG